MKGRSRWDAGSSWGPAGASTSFRTMVSVLTISGMVAVHSRRAVFTALSGVPGVARADVELGRAVVEHDATVTADALAEAIAVTGCEVTSVRVERRLPMTE